MMNKLKNDEQVLVQFCLSNSKIYLTVCPALPDVNALDPEQLLYAWCSVSEPRIHFNLFLHSFNQMER